MERHPGIRLMVLSNKSKQQAFQAFMKRGEVLLYLDPRKDEIELPAHLTGQPMVILRLGMSMPIPIPDIEAGEEMLSATLSFDRSPFFCRIPWLSVFGMCAVSGEGWLWYDDAPSEVMRSPTKQEKLVLGMPDGGAQQVNFGGPEIREPVGETEKVFGVLDGGGGDEEKTPSKKDHLRLVEPCEEG